MPRADLSLLVIAGGVVAALHVGKLSPALPALGHALGVGLVQAGFLLSLVQLAGMTLGLAIGLAADTLGLKRTMIAGLLVLSLAGFAGGFALEARSLLVLRALEGVGVLLATMPAPGLVRRLVSPGRLASRLGLWGAYMPLGTSLALLVGPAVIHGAGWPAWWWLLSILALAMSGWIYTALPADVPLRNREWGGRAWPQRLLRTLRSRGPWLVALAFAMYSSQWLAVIGFLPTIYAQAGFTGSLAALATAAAAAVNIIGNVASGRWLQRGVGPARLLFAGFSAMALGGFLAFAPVWPASFGPATGVLQYLAILFFSMMGGLVPGTLFYLAVQFAPGEETVSTTVGWMQQWSSLGQFAGPPLVAWWAGRSGGWQWSWLVTGGCASVGLMLTALIARRLRGAAPLP